jgi:AraC family ethanolamine operon transcriptional activator
MNSNPDTPALAPRVHKFPDIDHFRSWAQNLQVECTPLVPRIAAQQTVLNLPGCGINYMKSFPRIVDAQLAAGCTAVMFSMDSGETIRVNGNDRDDDEMIVIAQGGARYHVVEPVERRHATIVFSPQMMDRGWPETNRYCRVFPTSPSAVAWLRMLVTEILAVSSTFDGAEAKQAAHAIKESVLAGIDAAFADMVAAPWLSRANSVQHVRLFQKIHDILAAGIGAPIYSTELARQVGVSVRTVHDTVHRYTGLSLHRYLRLRRLWLVRQRLREGTHSVKASALAYGFWHLGDFARSYRAEFGETPSQTLARAAM